MAMARAATPTRPAHSVRPTSPIREPTKARPNWPGLRGPWRRSRTLRDRRRGRRAGWLGFMPAALDELPVPAAALIAGQLDIALSSIAPARLNAESDARAEHLAQAMSIRAFRSCRDGDLDALRAWLGDRALGHDGPLALLRNAVDRHRRERLLRPGLTVLERLVAAARTDAEQIHRCIGPELRRPGSSTRSTSCSSCPPTPRRHRSNSSVRRPERSGGSATRSRNCSCCAA